MAPRSAKAKKPADVKVAETEAPKKGRGKTKNVEEVEQEEDMDLIEKVAPTVEKKTKRGKKAAGDTNDQEQTNGKVEEAAPPAKKGRKKKDVEEKPNSNGDPLGEDEVAPVEESEQNNENEDANGHSEELKASTNKGRKKQVKKDNVDKSEPKSGRGRKKQEPVESESADKEDIEEKSVEDKPKAKGRGRKPKVEDEFESNDVEADAKTEPASRSRKKGQTKPVKEKTPESEAQESPDEEKDDDYVVEEPKKKETKGRKQMKKGQAKDEENDEVKEDAPAKKGRKGMKKEEKGKGDVKDEEVMEEDVPEAKPAKGKRGQKKAVEHVESDEEAQDTGEPTTKRRRKVPDDKATGDDKKKAPPKNKATTNYEDLNFSNSSKTEQGKEWNFKICSWNVDGIRAWMGKGGLDYMRHEKPDILCLQETKCSQDKLPEELANLPGYHAYWLGSDQDGYAGVGIYTSRLAINVQYGLQNEDLDNEGRIITAEYEQFYLICTYVPNAGRKLVTLPKRLQWNDAFRMYVKELDKKKPVIICGDMNVSHNEIDLANPKTNRKNAGFTDDERAGMTQLLGEGFVDIYRHLNPDTKGAYTFWTYMMNSRAKNVGWRLDYFIVSERLLPSICDTVIRDQVYGSDHCPITLFLHLTSADKPKE